MMLKWIPWKYFLRRSARTFDIVDPLTLLARLRSFAQPSEIQEPIELFRGRIDCSGILSEWLQSGSPLRFGPTPKNHRI